MKGLFCPLCREPHADVSLSLADGDTFTCQECSETFSLDDVRALLAGAQQWQRLVGWVAACPARENPVRAAG